MHPCVKCNRNFETKRNLVRHESRLLPCRPATHFCITCKKGLASYGTLWQHKKTCVLRYGTSFNAVRVKELQKRLHRFFKQPNKEYFATNLTALEDVFYKNKGKEPTDDEQIAKGISAVCEHSNKEEESTTLDDEKDKDISEVNEHSNKEPTTSNDGQIADDISLSFQQILQQMNVLKEKMNI